MSKDEKIQSLIKEELKSESSREKYLNILDHRIDDNRKSMGKHFLVLLLTALAFPLLMETKISEISIGPLKIIDSKIALSLIPTVFTFVYYKYLMIWFDLVEQKRTFKLLTAELFGIDVKSFLNDRLKPFSITDSIDKHHSQRKLDSIGCITYFFWIPTGFILILFPFAFEFYLIKKVFEILNPKSIFEWLLFIAPILIGLFTILMLIQVIRNDLKKDKASTQQRV
ncbi:hypothetical protein [Mangrovimonas spongiae]|uniref:Uncharacterized protein n=1 Tax=Mangrovimonas spongiae TaxID=2494697 RepID=A0A428JY23_9FLAO|nr:hypothetical protein [Mangrovimonas spongiae]RSK39047.1 hypothetical protein EJA19_08890 [Mangrovimonas spongiae]